MHDAMIGACNEVCARILVVARVVGLQLIQFVHMTCGFHHSTTVTKVNFDYGRVPKVKKKYISLVKIFFSNR